MLSLRNPRLISSQFLTPRDRDILLARLATDSDAADSEPFEWKGVCTSALATSLGPDLTSFAGSAFKDHLVIAYSLLFHGFAFPLYSLSLFLPTIIAGLGYKRCAPCKLPNNF